MTSGALLESAPSPRIEPRDPEIHVLVDVEAAGPAPLRGEKDELLARCRTELARYKQPKDVLFIGYDEFPRSASGKILRHELEKRFGP